MIKKYLPFHQFKKIDESIIPEMMEAEGTCISFDLLSLEEMISNAEEGDNHNYYYDLWHNSITDILWPSVLWLCIYDSKGLL